MRIWYIALFCLFFICSTSLSVHAVQNTPRNELDTDALMEVLPDSARRWLDSAEISPEITSPTALESLFRQTGEMVREEFNKPVKTLLLLISVILILRLVSDFIPADFQCIISISGIAGTTAVLIPPLLELVTVTNTAVEAVSGFLMTALPIYVSLLVIIGSANVGSTYGTLTLTAANAMLSVFNKLIIPFAHAYLALICTASIVSRDIKHIPDTLYKAIKWTITLSVSLFTGFLSLQTLIAAGTDAVTGKAVKMIASGTVPIVGGAFGDALSIIGASAGTVKSGVGAFGILASIAILLPVCLRMSAWMVVCEAARFTADLYALQELSSFFRSSSMFIKILLAVLFSVGAVSIISAAILLCVRGVYG